MDFAMGRLSEEGRKFKAWSMFAVGMQFSAYSLIESMYNKNENLKDVCAILGWNRIEQGYLEEGLALMDKDYQLERLSNVWQINYVFQLINVGSLKKANLLFKKIIEEEPNRTEFCIGYQFKPLKLISKDELEQKLYTPG
jgi:hypothetical protein